jgi:hypothetical protein
LSNLGKSATVELDCWAANPYAVFTATVDGKWSNNPLRFIHTNLNPRLLLVHPERCERVRSGQASQGRPTYNKTRGDTPLVLWTLIKNGKVLRCELQPQTTDHCNLEVFEDDRLAFSHRWSVGGPARFVAASLKRARLREGWTEVASVTTPHGGRSFVYESLAFVAPLDCMYAPALILNLNDALHVLDWPTDYQFIDTDCLSPLDSMRGYPSPTLLWKGIEIFGLPEPTPPFKPH